MDINKSMWFGQNALVHEPYALVAQLMKSMPISPKTTQVCMLCTRVYAFPHPGIVIKIMLLYICSMESNPHQQYCKMNPRRFYLKVSLLGCQAYVLWVRMSLGQWVSLSDSQTVSMWVNEWVSRADMQLYRNLQTWLHRNSQSSRWLLPTLPTMAAQIQTLHVINMKMSNTLGHMVPKDHV